MARNKKKYVNPDEGIHSCEKCKDYHRHVRKLHERYIKGAEHSGSTYMLERFESELAFVNERVMEEIRKGYRTI